MGRQQGYRPPSTFRGADWLRLGAMIGLLFVVFMLMVRLRDPDMVRAIDRVFNSDPVAEKPQAALPSTPAPLDDSDGWRPARAGKKSGEPKATLPMPVASAPGANPAPPAETDDEAAGPTDEDPEQMEEIRKEFQAVTDRTEQIQLEEMYAYNRIVAWTLSQSFSTLEKRAAKDLEFNDFVRSPADHRGKLVEFTLNARLVKPAGEPPKYPVPLYEVWGPTAESGSWLYSAIVVNLPEGMPTGRYINEKVRFVGYFLKVQGYQPGTAKPNDKPLPAPLFIGRMVWIKPPAQTAETTDFFGKWTQSVPGWLVAFALVAAVGVVVLVAWLAAGRQRSGIRELSSASTRETLRVEEWLADDGLDRDGKQDENGS